ncbi:MAG: CDP-alcohol phosphatidyltransferase family protein [Gemmataceae bacterium]
MGDRANSDADPSGTVSPARRAAGWAVHFYTGTGLLLAALIVRWLIDPARTPETFRYCFLAMFLAIFIDATDGTLARMVRIREAIPRFDGRRLDDLVDFLLYTCLPLLLIDQAGLLSEAERLVLPLALMASAYGFCQTDIKTDDGSFLGFPSYWNIVAYYLYAADVRGAAAAGLILLFAVLTFVPSRYSYPTQPGRFNRWMLILSIPWGLLILVHLSRPWPDSFQPWLTISALYPVLYLALSWVFSLLRVLNRSAIEPYNPIT